MKYVKKLKRRPWKIPGQSDFNFDDCYIQNYPPLDLSKYEGDRNREFYKLQNDLLIDYNKTHQSNKQILWKMYPYIEGVVESLAKKNVCAGCKVPDFDEKCLEVTSRIMKHYEAFPYFRAEKLENVAFHKVREVFLDGNLQLNERARDFNYLMELQLEKEDKQKNNTDEKTVKEIEQDRKEEQELKEIKEFHYWQKNHKKGRYEK